MSICSLLCFGLVIWSKTDLDLKMRIKKETFSSFFSELMKMIEKCSILVYVITKYDVIYYRFRS